MSPAPKRQPFVEVFRSPSSIEAEVVRGLLDAHGIEAAVASALPLAVLNVRFGHTEFGISVPAEAAGKARELIAGHLPVVVLVHGGEALARRRHLRAELGEARQALRPALLRFRLGRLDLGERRRAATISVDAVEHGGVRRPRLVAAQNAVVIGIEPVEDRIREKAENLRVGDADAEKQEAEDDGDGYERVSRMSAGSMGSFPQLTNTSGESGSLFR